MYNIHTDDLHCTIHNNNILIVNNNEILDIIDLDNNYTIFNELTKLICQGLLFINCYYEDNNNNALKVLLENNYYSYYVFFKVVFNKIIEEDDNPEIKEMKQSLKILKYYNNEYKGNFKEKIYNKHDLIKLLILQYLYSN